jgi:hypothetical protein
MTSTLAPVRRRPLAPVPAQPRYETPDYAAMMRRMVAAYGRRVGAGDLPDLADMLEVRDLLDDAIAGAVRAQNADGKSWAAIGDVFGTSRQAAQQRFA